MAYGNRSPWKKYLYSPVSIVVGLILLVFLIRAAWSIRAKSIFADKRLEQAQQGLNDLQKQKTDLALSIAYLSTSEGIEATLRDKYHAVKEGESVAVIIDSPTIREASSSQQIDQVGTSWWKNLRSFIRRIF